MSESWRQNMRHAQRAVSIDNISFISNAVDDRHHLNQHSNTSTLAKDNNFSTLSNNHSTNLNNHITNTYHQYNTTTTTNNNNHMKTINNNNEDTVNIRNGNCINNNHCTNYQSNHQTNPINASTDNLNKASDDEPDNIIPWRAQLRKTNSRLSLIG